MTTSQGYMPRKSDNNVQGVYKGFPLPEGKEYRPSNIEKVNSILAVAIEQKQNFYNFYIPEDLPNNFSNLLGYFEREAKYLTLDENTHTNLGIFSNKREEEVLTLLKKRHKDFTVESAIMDIGSSLVTTYEAASLAYSFAEDLLVPKDSKKSKQMTGSDLTEEQKAMSLEFELKPTIVRRS
jgi:hypothetical protein